MLVRMGPPYAEERYRGHDVRVRAEERRPGYWGWSYVIDGRLARSSAETFVLFDAAAALRQGQAAARTAVDRMEGGGANS
jgi:hypothetical protein